MNGEFPWIYVAMLVIAFISWIFNRIQEAAAERQRAAELKRRRQEQPENPSVIDTPPPFPSSSRRSQTQSEPEPQPGELLSDLMEALGAPPQPKRETLRPAPTPARDQRNTTSRVTAPDKPPARKEILSAAERAALERLQSQAQTALPPTKVTHRHSSAAGAEVRALLKSSNGLRRAIVLKEVLDPPVSMRE